MLPIVCLGLNSIGANVIYYALNFSASTTGNSYGITMCLFGFAEFTGVFPLSTANIIQSISVLGFLGRNH